MYFYFNLFFLLEEIIILVRIGMKLAFEYLSRLIHLKKFGLAIE